jgi:pseudouridine-5'-phosphate glycosidase
VGTALTPFVLAHVARASQGRALQANIGLIVNNARTAGSFAAALANAASPIR